MLTDLAIRSLPSPEKGAKRYWDRDGLCLQVSHKGTKTFYLVTGTQRRFIKLGRYQKELTLAQARDKAKLLLAQPSLEEEVPTTLQKAIERFQSSHCDVHNKPRTAQETKRLLRYLTPISHRRLTSIKTGELLELIDQASTSQSERRHIFVAARAFFRWAQRQHLIKASPLHDVQAPGRVSSRDHLITDSDMARIYRAAQELGYPYGSMCLIAIHTGMRRGEVGGLRWSYITPETITLPPALTKNKREHVLPNLIGELLKPLPKTSDLLFPSSTGTIFSAWSDGKVALNALCGLDNFVIHDFRRYLSSTMARLAVPIDVTEAILNHISGSRSPIQRIYDRYNRIPEMREALQKYEEHIASLLSQA